MAQPLENPKQDESAEQIHTSDGRVVSIGDILVYSENGREYVVTKIPRSFVKGNMAYGRGKGISEENRIIITHLMVHKYSEEEILELDARYRKEKREENAKQS